MKDIRLGRRARTDLIEITAWFLEQSEYSSLANRFLLLFEETTKMLARYPQIGQEISLDLPIRLRHFVVRRFPNYWVFYEDREDAIRIVRVLHGARDVASLLQEEVVTNRSQQD